MKFSIFNLQLSIFLVLLLTSCEDEFLADAEDSQLVVEGWIVADGFPVVMVSRTLPVTTDYRTTDSLSYYIVRWARVTVSDGTDSVILTGMADARYTPPYIYTTGRMRGEAGKSYRLHVTYRGMEASATTTIPTSPPDSVHLTMRRSAQSDSLYEIWGQWRTPRDQTAYYQLFTRMADGPLQFLACPMGSVASQGTSATNTQTHLVQRGRQLTDKDYTPLFVANDTVTVRLARIDETSYRIWRSYTELLALSGNMFLATSANMESNIVGGRGYWCGMNDTVVIQNVK